MSLKVATFQLMFWGFKTRNKSFLLLVILMLLRFGLLEVVGMVALLLLQEALVEISQNVTSSFTTSCDL
jgi:hypothetical protein